MIPAKYYYDDATQDQWQSKKKLKKEASKDKRAKLDPENAASADSYNNGGASAKDVMENKAKSAKKVVLPGKSEPLPKADELPAETLKHETDLIPETELQMVFDDEGNEDGRVQEAPKAQGSKKTLDPEEQKAREQRRAELKRKLANKINVMREKRKAPGSKAGGPVKSREQMLAERKKKQEVRAQEKLNKKREREEAEEAVSDDDSDKSDEEEEEEDEVAVLFGNIVFKDGSRATSDLSKIRNGVDHKKKKGPSNNDIKGHLQKLEAKRRKLSSLTPEQQAKQQEKDKWSSLMSQAEGIKVKDDEKLLKKALKRKEKQKLKSEIQWKERKQVVKDTIAARQKRKEENLKSRRENKGKKSKHQPRLKKFTGTMKKGGKGKGDGKKRAGFEGSAKSKGKLK